MHRPAKTGYKSLVASQHERMHTVPGQGQKSGDIHLPGRARGAESRFPLSLPKAMAEPVRVMAPMRSPRKAVV